MRIIDLLNRIANGEEVPNELWYKGRLYKYNEDNNVSYCYTFRNPMQTLGLISMVDDLNDEVGIIEEEQDIEHYDMFDYFTGYSFSGTDKDLLDHLQINFEHINQELDYLVKKVNELKKDK